MGVSTTVRQTRSEQCRKNAQAKSEQKRQATFTAIEELKHEKLPVTRSAVARRAGVSVVFLRSHPDLLAAIAEAEQEHRLTPEDRATNPAKNVVITALRRRLDEQKQALAEKDAELRQKQREIDRLYGKLAAGSSLTDEELRQQLRSALRRLTASSSEREDERGGRQDK
jgi:Family of unknown function (DUF6262)